MEREAVAMGEMAEAGIVEVATGAMGVVGAREVGARAAEARAAVGHLVETRHHSKA